MNELDRRFDERCVEFVGVPEAKDACLSFGWRWTCAKQRLPDLVISCDEFIVFEGDRIRLMEGRPESDSGVVVLAYLDTHLGIHGQLGRATSPAAAGQRQRSVQARPLRLASTDRPEDPQCVSMRGSPARDLSANSTAAGKRSLESGIPAAMSRLVGK